MTKVISNIISWIFHPILIPIWGLVIIFNSGSYISHLHLQAKTAILLIVFFASVVLPIASTGFLYYQKLIKNFSFDNPKDRVLVLSVFSFYYMICWYVLNNYHITKYIKLFILYLAIISIISTLISIKWKITPHMIGIGALTGNILAFAFQKALDIHAIVMILFVVSGLVAYVRLADNKNTPAQVYSSYALGFILLFVAGYLT